MRILALVAMAVTWCASVTFSTFTTSTVAGIMWPHHTLAQPVGLADQARPYRCTLPGAMPRCYTPAQLQMAYHVTPLLSQGDTGAGVAIAIIDAYQSPTLAHDLRLFDRRFHLPNPVLAIRAPQGVPAFNPANPTQVDWAGEITLDVEWAHALAPAARIVLVEARSDADQDLLAATRWAVFQHAGAILSQSYGEAEDCAAPSYLHAQHQIFMLAVAHSITPVAAAGDSGAGLPDCRDNGYHKAVSSPASDPYVLAVGGTHLQAPNQAGNRTETVWNNGLGATGGGYSEIYGRPIYQNDISTQSGRGLPDVASDADPQTGLLGIWSSSGMGKNLTFTFGGTSAGAPVWAGILALAVQHAGHGLGWVNPRLYALFASAPGRLHPRVARPIQPPLLFDITSGSNTVQVPNAQGHTQTIVGDTAHVGWDAVTGWGTPDAVRLVPVLAGC